MKKIWKDYDNTLQDEDLVEFDYLKRNRSNYFKSVTYRTF